MNNHNFVDWELTKLLPKDNPKSIDYVWFYLVPHRLSPKTREGEGYLPTPYYELEYYDHKHSGFIYESSEIVCDAWTWEDLRVYLVKRKIAVSIIRKTKKSGFECYRVTVEEVENGRYAIVSIDDYGSYEEARLKGYRNALALL